MILTQGDLVTPTVLVARIQDIMNVVYLLAADAICYV